MDNRRYNELVVFIIRNTGWTLDYIRNLPINELVTIAREMGYQKELETYKLGSYAAIPAVMMAKKGTRLSDIIGNPPRKEGEQMAEKNLASETENQPIKLNDGKEYLLAPINLNILSDIEDKFDKPFSEILKNPRLKYSRYIVFLRLKPNHPEITEEQVGKLFDLNTLKELLQAVNG